MTGVVLLRRFQGIRCVLAAAALALMLLSVGCDKVPGKPHGATFYAVNHTDYDLRIYLNAQFASSVKAGSQSEAKRVDEGAYDAMARRQSDDEIVKEEQLYLEEDETFRWVID